MKSMTLPFWDDGLKLLKELVSIPSTSPDGERYEDVMGVLKEFFSYNSIDYELIRVPEEYQKKYCSHVSSKPRYIFRARVGNEGTWLQFNGHYDVVPGGPGWKKTEPFSPLVEGDLVYGRGTTDMKGGLVSMALALLFIAENKLADGLVDAVFVPDEEVGGECGTGYYVQTLTQRKPDFVVIPEPSSPKHIYIGHKGGIWVKVLVKGKTAHASTPWFGKNAFTSMAKIVNWLEENYVSTLRNLKSKYKYDLPEGNTPTAMIGGEAGVPNGKANQVPGEAYFTIDRRTIVEESLDDAQKELFTAIKEAAKANGIGEDSIEIRVMTRVEPAFVKPNNTLSVALKRAAVQEGFEEPEEIVCIGGLDLRYYSVKNILAVSYGPGEVNTAHSPDEFVNYKQVYKFAKIYSRLPSLLF